MIEQSKETLFREAFALLEQANKLLLDAKRKHEEATKPEPPEPRQCWVKFNDDWTMSVSSQPLENYVFMREVSPPREFTREWARDLLATFGNRDLNVCRENCAIDAILAAVRKAQR